MNKLKIITLLVFFSANGACFQKPSTNSVKSSTPVSTVSPDAGKTAETTVQSNSQTSAGGDYNAAMNFYNSKNYEKAAAEFESVVKEDAKNQPAHLHLARSYRNTNKKEKAVGAYRTAIELQPNDADANYELGSIYMTDQNYETALPFIQKAAKIKYTSAPYLIALGDTYRELKKCDYAMPPYGNALGFEDKNPKAFYGMGLCYIELKNKLAAAQQLSNLEKVDKNLAKKLAEKLGK